MEKNLPKRKCLRLNNYNYSNQGMYFITICTKDRIKILGNIANNKINLTTKGITTLNYLKNMENIFNCIHLDEYVIMPNHIHAIIIIDKKNEIDISRIIKQYKGIVTKKLGHSIWQKSYYDHIIRNETEYYQIKKYIQNNIINWNHDKDM